MTCDKSGWLPIRHVIYTDTVGSRSHDAGGLAILRGRRVILDRDLAVIYSVAHASSCNKSRR